MPTYILTDSKTGKKYRVTGDDPPEQIAAEFERQLLEREAQAAQTAPAAPVQRPTGASQALSGAAGAAGAGAGTAQVAAKGPDKPTQAQITQQAAEMAARDTPWLERNLAGMGGAVVSAGQGLRQFASEKLPQGWVSPPAEEDLVRARTIGNEAPVGNILGNIMLTAAPLAKGVTAAASVANALTKVPKLGKALAALGTASAIPAVGGAAGALRPVVGDETRMGNVAQDAAMSVVGDKVGKVLTRALSSPVSQASITPAGRALLEQTDDAGNAIVMPTVKGATDGTGVSGLIGTMQTFKDFLTGRAKVTRTEKEVLDQVGREINPTGTANLVGRMGVGDWAENTKHEFDTAFKGILANKTVPIDNLDIHAMKRAIQHSLKNTASSRYMDQSTRAVDEAFTHANKMVKDGRIPNTPDSAEYWHAVMNYLKDRSRTYTDGKLALDAEPIKQGFDDALNILRSKGQASLGSKAMGDLDTLYDKFQGFTIAKKATLSKPGLETSGRDLIKAADNSPETLGLAGTGKFQNWTKPLYDVLEAEKAPSSISRRLGYGAIALGAGGAGALAGSTLGLLPVGAGLMLGKMAETRGGAKYLLGQNKWQQEMAKYLRKDNWTKGVGASVGGSSHTRNAANLEEE